MDKKALYIFKKNQLYAKLEDEKFYLFKDNQFILKQERINEILDILPEGIDLKIMLEKLKLEKSLELFAFLKNPIGDFSFSKDMDRNNNEKIYMSNIANESNYPKILNLNIQIPKESLVLQENINSNPSTKQNLSLSGYQHKLQVSIENNILKENYADFILKPLSQDFAKLAINEHLHVNFMKEFGFEVPFNAIVFDERFGNYHYLIKRFDINEKGEKKEQISLNALMNSEDKYSGTIEQISHFLKDKLNKEQKTLFLKFIYANALIYNNDLHKKNISFFVKDNELKLTPVYDTINIYPIKKLSNEQCVLKINGRTNKIRISDFQKSSEILGIDFKEFEKDLQNIFEIYKLKYPIYVNKLSEIPNFKGVKEFKHKLLESYEKNLSINKENTLNANTHNENFSYKFQTFEKNLNEFLRKEDNRFADAKIKDLESLNKQYEILKKENIPLDKKLESKFLQALERNHLNLSKGR